MDTYYWLISNDKPLYVWGDEFKYEEVVTNYISNAIHHVRDGGNINIYFEMLDDRARVHVSNTGDPISKEDQSRLWDKFYKVDKAHSRSYGGTGIGLSIVKAIMDAHGMCCGVSNIQDGVDFWFEADIKN